MAIDFTSLFTKTGKILGALNETNTYRTTLATRASTLVTQYVSDQPDTVVGVYAARDSAQQNENGWLGYLTTLLSDTIVAEVNADRPLVNKALSTALPELVRQMRVSSQALDDDPPTLANGDVGTPVGDYTVVTSSVDGTGVATDLAIPDVFLVVVEADKDTGATRWADSLRVTGKTVDPNALDYTYPTGTGVDTTVTVVDPAGSTGYVLDTSFDEWEGTGNNTPSQWAIFSGLAGTNIFRVADDPRDSTNGFAARLVGDGATGIKLRQEITVEPNTVLRAYFRVKKVADPGTDWAVSVRLTDGAGATLAGPNSVTNVATSATAASVAANWTNIVTGTFVTPAALPVTGVYFEIVFHQFGAIGTAAASGAECHVDFATLVDVTPLYAGGVAVTYFSGLVDGVVGDARTFTTTLPTAPSASIVQGLNRFLDLTAYLPLRIPTASGGSVTQADSLIS